MTNKWTDFYERHFPSREQAQDFVDACEQLPPRKASDNGVPLEGHPAKIMMHQTVRLISTAEEMAVRTSREDGLCLLFCLICAENIAKLAAEYRREGNSRQYTREFFDVHVPPEDRHFLKDCFKFSPREPTELRMVVDALYDVRCEIVHQGRTWGFSFSPDGKSYCSGGVPFFTRLLRPQFVDIVVRGCVEATQGKLRS